MLDTRIGELRKEKGISQEQLAEALNTTRQAVSKWERGESYPDIDRLKELAAYFNVSIDYLLNYDVESISVNRFIQRGEECMANEQLDITLEEIRLVVSANPNHVALLSGAIEYLVAYWGEHHEDAVADAIIEYAKRLLILYRPDNESGFDLNEIHLAIAGGHMLKGDYDSAHSYILENHLYGADDYLMNAEIELGRYEEASKRASSSFLKSVFHVINAQFVQFRTFLKLGEMEAAYELSKWTYAFLESIREKGEGLLLPMFIFVYAQAICERHLSLDASSSISYLKENVGSVIHAKKDTEGVRFYYSEKPTSFVVMVGDLREFLKDACVDGVKDSPAYQSALSVFNDVFGG